jgi:outer membrane protein assembly factor BamD (BamD/ComL family)
MLTALLVLAALQDWQYVEGRGYVDRSSGRVLSPEEMLQTGTTLRDAGDTDGARRVFGALAYSAPQTAQRERAQWEIAETHYRAADFEEAYHAFREFVNRFPQSALATDAKRREMEAGLEMAKSGAKVSTLGLRIFSSTTPGVEALRETLRRYPREEFSADFSQKLGMVFYRRGEYDAAAAEFQLVLDQYSTSAEAVLAVYMLGVTAEHRFDGIDRDVKPLKESRRVYERFLEEADRMRRLPDPAPRWVDELVPAVRQRLGRVYGLLHEKTLKTADYYYWKEYYLSALIYYRTLLRDESIFRRVLPNAPEHPAVTKSRGRVAELTQ